MDIYAIRKNRYAGVYTKKEIFEYIKDIELKTSVRVFKESEKKEALKWAGVDSVNRYHSSLKTDKEFKKLLAKLDFKDIIDVKETRETSEVNLSQKSLVEGLHKYSPEKKDIKGIITENNLADCINIPKKDFIDIKNDLAIINVIEKYKKEFNMFRIKTLSFGDIYYLCDFWYYEKPWNIEYGYSLKDLIKYDYIDYKLASKVKVESGCFKMENIYKLDKTNEFEEITFYQELIFLSLSEIRGIIPIKKDFLCWYSEGEYRQFMTKDLKSKEIENLLY